MSKRDSSNKIKHENIGSNEENADKEKEKKSIIVIPEFFKTRKCRSCWKLFKYIYVISVICIGFLIIFLQQISDPIDNWLDSQQRIILTFLIDENVIYILLVLFVITVAKSFGIKDVLGLRTISVVVLSFRIVPNSPILTLLVCMLIIGVLSSISKLIEYKVIGHELQVVQGTPVEYIFKYSRKALLFCIKNEEKLYWFDPKWTFEISTKSRDDKTMDVITNIEAVVTDLKCKCNQNNNDDENDNDKDIESQRTDNNKQEENEEDTTKCTAKYIVRRAIYFIVAVIWTSVIEWVQPITELFLFAHNWSLSIRNVIVIVLSEFADFDKAVEAWLLIKGIHDGLNIIDAKVDAILSKVVFWALGYCLVMPPTLLWAYWYHQKYIASPQNNDDNNNNNNNNNNDNQQRQKTKDKLSNGIQLNNVTKQNGNTASTSCTHNGAYK